jgi:hypothetical protein
MINNVITSFINTLGIMLIMLIGYYFKIKILWVDTWPDISPKVKQTFNREYIFATMFICSLFFVWCFIVFYLMSISADSNLRGSVPKWL